jgi:hypothetical protein
VFTGSAIVVAIAVPWVRDARNREAEHRIAEVIVAAALRAWLRTASIQIAENRQYTGTDGEDGQRALEMPSLTPPLDKVAEMRPAYARQVLSVLERRERRQRIIDGAAYYGDEREALMEYYSQIARLFWSVRRIYIEIARARGLDERTNRPEELATVRYAAAEAKAFKNAENAGLQ